jgi:ankyrin repeat protein
MTEEREPDGFKLAAEQNIRSARFNARTAPKKTPQEQELLKHHRIMMTAAHNGVLETFSAMNLALQKSIVNWHDADRSSLGDTALMRAAGRGHIGIVKHLLSIGADISQTDDNGSAANSHAAGHGCPEMVAILLAAGANPDHLCMSGWTPLMHAMLDGRAEAAQLLLEHGAQTRVPTPFGEDIRAGAVMRGHHAIAAMIDAEEKNRGAAAAMKLVEKGTAETMTVTRPLKLKPR